MTCCVTTVGYEGLSPDVFLRLLRQAGVRRVVDVRALANSRRPGFAKRALTASLVSAGVEYQHVPALGTPATGREALRSGRISQFRAIYDAHLGTHDAQVALAELAETTRSASTCLLCLEADPAHCHRTIIGDRLSRDWGYSMSHLRGS